ncbi:hypothetical protein NP493_8710g00006 [Ridgeia piscesae]|uniref:C2H2-type domain-containing protein n=1 Tax=Ridgeia piscesae TaxID=27915 RepID=A0AAD9IMP6_RIDPI|nr:hypothetical protein NP493_8710g00006 [Ridgeia piscesae]
MVVSTSGDTANQSPVCSCIYRLSPLTPAKLRAHRAMSSLTLYRFLAHESSNVTYVNVSSTTNPLRVGDLGAGVGVGSIDQWAAPMSTWCWCRLLHTMTFTFAFLSTLAGRRPYSCDKCPYNATTSSNLRRHQLIHAEVRSFQCTICDVKFRQKIHLERHIKYKHQEKSVECPHCDYHCANVTPDLKIHLQRKHQIGVDQPQPPLRCSDCSFTTVSRKDLKQHEKFHKSGPELKLYCEECCFVTDCQSRLKRHLLTHTHERPFSCALCNYRATQKEHIARHMKAKHEAEAPTGIPTDA